MWDFLAVNVRKNGLFIGDMYKRIFLVNYVRRRKEGNVEIKKYSRLFDPPQRIIMESGGSEIQKFEISYRFRETYVMSWRKFFRGSHETAMALDVLKITRSRQTMFLEFTITRGYLFAVCYPKPYARTFTRFFICRGELYLGSTSFYR